jgi:4-amino-4-deoxy-L-arabinose transferase-like glycosyltransferase
MGRGGWSLLALVAVAWPALFWRLGSGPIDRSMEGREALVVQEIVRTGDWILPRRNGDDVPHKPPLAHWIGAGVAEMRGGVVDEATVRFPSALASLVSLVGLFLLVAGEHGPGRGLLAALVLLTTQSFTVDARQGWVDATLAAAVVLALAAFWRMERRQRWDGALAFAAAGALAAAFLAKGPIGVGIPGVAIAAYLWTTGRLGELRRRIPPAPVLLLVALVVPWYAAALWRGGAAFFETQVVQENLLRLVRGPEGSRPPWYFLGVVGGEGAPWTLLLPLALWRAWRARREPSLETFALAWFVAPFLALSLAAGKRPVYLLPLMPAMAILVEDAIASLRPWRTWRPGLAVAAATVAAGGLAVGLGWLGGAALGWWSREGLQRVVLSPLANVLREHPAVVVASAAAAVATAAVFVVALAEGRPREVCLAVLALQLVYVSGVKPLYWAAYREARALDRFAAATRAEIGDAPLAHFGTGEVSHYFFYLDRHVPRAACRRFADCGPGHYLVAAPILKRLRREAQARTRVVVDSRRYRESPSGTPYLVVEVQPADRKPTSRVTTR